MSTQRPLFSAYGVELEYMIVDADTLDVKPICDQVMHDVSGEFASEIERGEIAWSNELALHVIELKTNGPAPSLIGLADKFQENVRQINEILNPHNARLLPTAMHPWMDPLKEMKLWPHEYSPVYDAFNRIFDCKGHGWANLQSTHLNLPFNGDEEFGRLHAAIRLILPLLPSLAASSPVIDGKVNMTADNRLAVYRGNAAKIPEVSGMVIPERAYDEASYQRLIFDPLFKAIAPHDPEGILKDEFLNARGAIARFSRGSIEIRVLDIQECPKADLAICAFIVEVLKLLVSERWTSYAEQRLAVTKRLHEHFMHAVQMGANFAIQDADYVRHFGVDLGEDEEIEVQSIWYGLLADVLEQVDEAWRKEFRQPIEKLLEPGNLSMKIAASLPIKPSREQLRELYGQLAGCLAEGRMYDV